MPGLGLVERTSTLAFVSSGMQRQLAAFVEHPCKTTFLAARNAVLRHSPVPLVAADLADLDRLLEQNDLEILLDRLDSLPASKVFSPHVHYLAAEAAEALGRTVDVELERSLFVLMLQGLLATGDGTPASPYAVCHPTDEYDILAALGLESAGQSLAEHDGRLCDVLTCTNGREVWFDVTDLVARPRQDRKPPQKPRGARRRLLGTIRLRQ